MIELETLGTAELRNGEDGRRLASVLAQPKRFALLAYLAVATPHGFHRRDTLLGLFWPEFDQDRARAALRRSLHFLRRSLGPDVLLGRGQEEVGLAGDRFRCDAAEFDRALEQERGRAALELYGGELLPGFYIDDAPAFERWLDEERVRIRRSAYQAAWKLAEEEQAGGSVLEAAHWARRARRIDPYDEDGARRLIALLARHGDPGGAVRAYERFTRGLAEDLGLEPSPETRALADSVREGRARPATISDSSTTSTEEGGSPRKRDRVAGAEYEGPAPRTAHRDDPPPTGQGRPAAPRAGSDASDWSRLVRWPSRRAATGAAALAAVLAGAALLGVVGGADRRVGPPSVAVLPFEDLGSRASDAYLADGVTEDITVALARASGLAVTSRVSAMKYRDTDLAAPEIAGELGVTHLLEGTVRRDGERVQISAQLIDGRSDRHLWAATYERRLTDLFAVQGAVARSIARELGLRISRNPPEDASRRPTTSPEAYDFYLRGRDYLRTRSGDLGETLRHAVRMLERALALDPGLVEARAHLARAHLGLYQWSAGRDAERLDLAREAVERALSTDPESPWAHVARGDYARTTGELQTAVEAYETAEELGLATGEVVAARAAVARDMGRLEEAVALYERARATDPWNEELIFQGHFAYLFQRRYGEAAEALDRVLELAPDHVAAGWHRPRIPLYRDGDAAATRDAGYTDWEVHWRLGDLEAALEEVDPHPDFPGAPGIAMLRTGLLLAAGGDSSRARAAFDSARALLEPEARKDSVPSVLGSLAQAYAGLGREGPASSAADRGLEVARRLHIAGAAEARLHLVWTHVLLGNADPAIDALDAYLANPGSRSFAGLATHPLARPLLRHPRFQRLEERYGGAPLPEKPGG